MLLPKLPRRCPPNEVRRGLELHGEKGRELRGAYLPLSTLLLLATGLADLPPPRLAATARAPLPASGSATVPRVRTAVLLLLLLGCAAGPGFVAPGAAACRTWPKVTRLGTQGGSRCTGLNTGMHWPADIVTNIVRVALVGNVARMPCCISSAMAGGGHGESGR